MADVEEPPVPEVADTAPALVDIDSVRSAQPIGAYVVPEDADSILKSFLSEVNDVARDSEVVRILSCFKLNPYEHLNLHFDCAPEEIRKQYRKLSLMVHPDKCKHERARDAFEVLGKAQALLMDEEFMTNISPHLARSKELVIREWKKQAKDDVVLRLRHAGDKEAMLNDFSTSEEFHERWKAKTRQVMTDFEWRKRRLGIRLKEEEERISKGEKEAMAEMREQQKAQKEWDRDDHREKRVASWRDFMHTQKTKKKKGGLKSGEFIPPKPKMEEKKEKESFGGPKGNERVQRPDEVSRAW